MSTLANNIFRMFGVLNGLGLTGAFSETTRVSSSGHEYAVSCNSNGFVLISIYPIARTVKSISSVETVRKKESLYLGKSCDSYSAFRGNGQ